MKIRFYLPLVFLLSLLVSCSSSDSVEAVDLPVYENLTSVTTPFHLSDETLIPSNGSAYYIVNSLDELNALDGLNAITGLKVVKCQDYTTVDFSCRSLVIVTTLIEDYCSLKMLDYHYYFSSKDDAYHIDLSYQRTNTPPTLQIISDVLVQVAFTTDPISAQTPIKVKSTAYYTPL